MLKTAVLRRDRPVKADRYPLRRVITRPRPTADGTGTKPNLPLRLPLQTLTLLRSGPFAHHHERRPVGGVRLTRFAGVDHSQHAPAQGFGAADGLVASRGADS
jgi:hypothetical protein